MIQRILRKFVPTILKRAKGHLHYTWYWSKRDLKFSSLSGSKESRLAFLMVNSHVLEKGLTMPNRKLGFGYKKVREIISYCSSCIKDFGTDSVEVQSTLDDLNEYLQIHRDSQFGLPEDIENGISDLLKYRKSHSKSDSYYFTRDTFFKPAKNFEELAYSRHTVRNYSSEPVDIEKIKHCHYHPITLKSEKTDIDFQRVINLNFERCFRLIYSKIMHNRYFYSPLKISYSYLSIQE